MKTRTLVVPMLLLTACPAVEPTGEDPGGSVPAPVQATFTMYCQANGTCHVSGGQAPDLTDGVASQSLEGTAMNGQKYVVFFDVDNSRLAQILLPTTPGQMPPIGYPPPPSEEVAIIFGWIAGAPFPEEETTTTMPTTTMESGSSGGDPMLCSLEVVDATADVAMAVDAGDGAGQVPTVVGEALVHSCGCHYTDTIPMEYGVPYAGNQGMSTLAEFQGDWMGTLPANTGQPAYEAISARISGMLVMPPVVCDPDGEPSTENATMTQADYDLLMDWLGMMAPDGATYEPPA